MKLKLPIIFDLTKTLMAPNQHSFVMNYLIDSIRFFSLAKKKLICLQKGWNFQKYFTCFRVHTIFFVLLCFVSEFWFNETLNSTYNMYRLIAKTQNQLINSNSGKINNASILSSWKLCFRSQSHELTDIPLGDCLH